jgi:crossover junction endodeoxyribonuclease RuvC
LFSAYPDAFIVREGALLNIATSGRTVQVLSKVVGVSDLYAWGFGGKEFEDISPKTVKKLVANNDNAEKEEVAKALEQFVGKRDYACDDESDAVAVGIAYLIQQKMIDSPYPEKKKK